MCSIYTVVVDEKMWTAPIRNRLLSLQFTKVSKLKLRKFKFLLMEFTTDFRYFVENVEL